jgi:hypothetical protein
LEQFIEAAISSSPAGERLAIMLGLLAATLVLATFISCRSCLALFKWAGLERLTRTPAYRRFNRYHAQYWLGFGAVVSAHIVMAAAHTGLPTPGDPDSPLHWAILGAGLIASLASLSMFASCRVFPTLVIRGALAHPAFKRYFSYHTYFWLLFLALAAGHFTLAYLHAGIWPG